MAGIILSINMRGRIGGPVKHTDKQTVTVEVTPLGAKYPEYLTRKIKHNDRIITTCSRKLRIPEEVVNTWIHSDCPSWEKPHIWKTMPYSQRISSYLKTYDEGYGISYETI